MLHNSVVNKRTSNILCQVSLAVQLAFSIFFTFTSASICHQYRDSFRKDWGFSVKNTAMVFMGQSYYYADGDYRLLDYSQFLDRIKELPMVEDAISDGNVLMGSINVGMADGYLSTNPDDEGIAACTDGGIKEPWKPIYGFTVVEGELPKRVLNSNEIVISRDVAQKLGLKNAVGQTIYLRERHWGDANRLREYKVVAVLKEIYFAGPLKRPLPIYFLSSDWSSYYSILIKYKDGTRHMLEKELEKLNLPGELSFAEDRVIERSLNSTTKLFNLMLIFSAICILISVSGVWSVVILSCRKRRREIAIRKTFGARTWEVFSIFLREYGMILAASSVPAFCLGFLFINHWREQFQQQAVISWWIYAAVLAGMAAIIYMVVVCSVLRTARENPADVMKSE